MRWADLLTAGVVASVTSLLTLVLKEALFPRSLERWRERRSLAATYRRYRDPIVLSARELGSRLIEIHEEFPTGYLDGDLWEVDDPFDIVNEAVNVHFRKYKLFSTVYRLCAMFGWMELYRVDVAFLDAGHNGKNKKLEASIHSIQAGFAEGKMNQHEDWSEWTDRLLFREEQRAIGEAMIRGSGSERAVIGYGAFCSAIENRDPTLTRFARLAVIFVSDCDTHALDFRKVRFREIALCLIALIEELDQRRLLDHMREWRDGVMRWRDPARRWLDLEDLGSEEPADLPLAT